MNDRFRNERNRGGVFGRQGQGPDERSGWSRGDQQSGWSRGGDERPGWERGDADEERGWRAQAGEPQYSSDWDETYGSEWERGRSASQNASQNQRTRYGQSGSGQGGYGQGGYGQGGYGQGGSQRERGGGGWYSHGSAGMYGGGSGAGYVGGHGGSGYGGSTGTDYGAGSYGGGSYGGSGREQGVGRERGFGGARDQGFRGRDIGSPGTDPRGGFAGRGPKGYTRTDERIREDVCDRLSMDDDVDASEIEVRVENGEVTLVGTVQTRSMKHRAEDLAGDVSGASDVHNQLRVMKSMLNELKDKITGKEGEGHYANSGTRDKPANGTLTGSAGRNGTL